MRILFAVATTNTGVCFSCIQVRKVPKTRVEVPESPLLPPTPPKPFSISSTQSIEGATASAVARARRMFSSELPTKPENIFPKSSLRRGRVHMALIAFAVRLFPQPGTPVIKTPLGAGILYFCADSVQERFLLESHFFRFSKPPISSACRSERTNSKIPVFFIT